MSGTVELKDVRRKMAVSVARRIAAGDGITQSYRDAGAEFGVSSSAARRAYLRYSEPDPASRPARPSGKNSAPIPPEPEPEPDEPPEASVIPVTSDALVVSVLKRPVLRVEISLKQIVQRFISDRGHSPQNVEVYLRDQTVGETKLNGDGFVFVWEEDYNPPGTEDEYTPPKP